MEFLSQIIQKFYSHPLLREMDGETILMEGFCREY